MAHTVPSSNAAKCEVMPGMGTISKVPQRETADAGNVANKLAVAAKATIKRITWIRRTCMGNLLAAKRHVETALSLLSRARQAL